MLSHSETNCLEILAVLRVLLAQGQIQGQQLPVVRGWSTRGGQWWMVQAGRGGWHQEMLQGHTGSAAPPQVKALETRVFIWESTEFA